MKRRRRTWERGGGCRASTFSPRSEDADAKSTQLLGRRRVAISHQGTSDGRGGNAAAADAVAAAYADNDDDDDLGLGMAAATCDPFCRR